MQANHKLNSIHLNLTKAFRFLHDEQELKEIESLINFHFEKKLDDSIVKAENERNYDAAIYDAWLKSGAKNSYLP